MGHVESDDPYRGSVMKETLHAARSGELTAHVTKDESELDEPSDESRFRGSPRSDCLLRSSSSPFSPPCGPGPIRPTRTSSTGHGNS